MPSQIFGGHPGAEAEHALGDIAAPGDEREGEGRLPAVGQLLDAGAGPNESLDTELEIVELLSEHRAMQRSIPGAIPRMNVGAGGQQVVDKARRT